MKTKDRPNLLRKILLPCGKNFLPLWKRVMQVFNNESKNSTYKIFRDQNNKIKIFSPFDKELMDKELIKDS